MATFMFKGVKERGGIPSHSKVRVESLPKRYCVFSGHVTKAVALELDPGKYAFKVGCFPEGKPGMKYSGEFLWGLTEAEYHTLKDVKPKAMKVINTSEGVRYICQFTACDGEFTSATGAVLHEAEHQGQKLIASQGDEDFTPPELVLAEHLRAQQKAQEQQALARERGEKIQDVIDSGAQKEQDNKSQKAFRTAQRQVV